ncbi:MAG: hypothetical protein FD176_662 [Rhodospirillaceae bacterium]|nr:MAG: hypothetical protein FD176_662 [Rhodospirillaceae bacterium]TNC94755.1 MAG: Uncharacterized protein FD119_2999 [Stygiobacter sp.]
MGSDQPNHADALTLAELLCARICHDLAGPVGATAAGAELFQDLGGGDPETLAMVSTSAAGASSRLRLLRAALGPAASSPQTLSALRTMAEAHLNSLASTAAPAIACRWSDCPDEIDGPRARLLLNLMLLGRDALPRGGAMDFAMIDGWPALIARGEPAALADDVKATLLTDTAPTGAKTAQAALTRMLAEGMGGRISVSVTARGLRLAAEACALGTI